MSDVQNLPRGPILTEANPTPDYTDNYQRSMLQWRNVAYSEAVRFKNMAPETPARIRTTIRYLEGDQWDQFGPRAKYKSKAYINKVGGARISNLALLTDTRPEIEVKSPENAPGLDQIAKRVDGIIRHEWETNDFDLNLMEVADIAGVTGTGFWKIGAGSPGMMSITACGSDMVMPIQPGKHIQTSTGVLFRTWKPLGSVLLKCGKNKEKQAKIERQGKNLLSVGDSASFIKPDSLDLSTWNGLAPQLQAMLGRRADSVLGADGGGGQFLSVEWQEYYIDDTSLNESSERVLMKGTDLAIDEHNWWYWVEPGQRLYPRKRLIVFAGDVLFYDGPSPYWHGLFPFPSLSLNPVFWSFYGLSKYRDLIPINQSMNEIVAGTMDSVKRALNQTVVAKGTIPRASWDQFFPDMPGAKLYLNNPMANPAADVQFIPPPMLPQYVPMTLQFLGPEFDKLAGQLDVTAMGGKAQVPGGDTLEQMRDSLQTQTRREGRLIEVFLRDAGIQTVSNILQFYRPKRIMEILNNVTVQDFSGDKDSLIPGDENKFDFWRKFPLRVLPGSMHGGAKDRSKMMFISLAQMGMVSRSRLLSELGIDDVDDATLAKERESMMAAGAPLRMSRGQRNGAPM
jgi:hypothetical protein